MVLTFQKSNVETTLRDPFRPGIFTVTKHIVRDLIVGRRQVAQMAGDAKSLDEHPEAAYFIIVQDE